MSSLTYSVVRRLATKGRTVRVSFDDGHTSMSGQVEREDSTYRVVERPSGAMPIGFLFSLYRGRTRANTLSNGTLEELDGEQKSFKDVRILTSNLQRRQTLALSYS